MKKKRTLSPEHLAKLQAGRLKAQTPASVDIQESPKVLETPTHDDYKRQIDELKANVDMLTKAMLNQNSMGMTRDGELVGEFDKYSVDPSNYPDPTPRLAKEPRLKPLGFEYNYELDYDFALSSYQTKTGKNLREPKFTIKLYRIVMDDDGQPTDKRYIARQIIFHEDPEAALVMAREQGLPVDKSNERMFLNEMRYYRVRDWLFGIFWPQPSDAQARIHEEVIGNTLVQVFTKASETPGNLPFDKLESKVRV